MKTEIQTRSGFINYKSKSKQRNASTWALSYGDMVTALLCFFIIFYAIEKQLEKRISNPLKGYAESEGILKEHKSSEIDTSYEYAIESLESLPGIELLKTSTFVDIYFKNTVFFEKGATLLNPAGKLALNEVMKRLSKIEKKYILEIQGHADSTPVKNIKKRWWTTNMELSVLRALNVHAFMAENFIEKSNLVVSGHSNLSKLATNNETTDDANRRISLRLQVIK